MSYTESNNWSKIITITSVISAVILGYFLYDMTNQLALAANLQGTKSYQVNEYIETFPVSDEVNVLYGASGHAATRLDRPGNKKVLVLIAQDSEWWLRFGDFVSSGMPVADVTGSITGGTAAIQLEAGKSYIIQAASECTVSSYSGAAARLIYYYN